LMACLSDVAISMLGSQIEAGASAVQLFDSWIGCLDAEEYRTLVKPHVDRIIKSVQKDHAVPFIYFGTNTTHLLPEFGELSADVIGVDWRIDIDDAWKIIGDQHGIQGNLNPELCVAGFDDAAVATKNILTSANQRNGHIFNLGHGVLPETDPSVLEQIVLLVHEESKR
jgi:uroporphyrinogen decarboxylase